ncbi:M1 family aminopeptidase [Sporosalibacterium faouarense]|uniref:M1 family aminopeptidase n=1 Tax=Sporosalibacterium faouarense TaxID=516123 RepID=UPI00192A84BA|nr:M1 family aminopeptidase [Sporosalibacterium faouarense]
MKSLFNYFRFILYYICYRWIEGKGSNLYFNINERKMSLYINFEKKTLVNKALYSISKVKNRRRITFWIGFREEIKIKKVNLNKVKHDNFKLYSVVLPFFNYKVNYLVLDKIEGWRKNEELDVSIDYEIKTGNYRDDMSTILENYIENDEFHLYALWYPILGNKIKLSELLSGDIPEANKCPFEINVSLSKKGIVVGEGEVTQKSYLEYRIKSFRGEKNKIFLCGGKLDKICYSSKNLDINFYYRHSRQKDFQNLQHTLFEGIDDIINNLNNFQLNKLNLYGLPIIAGGYGLTHGIIINENYFVDSDNIDNYSKYSLIWHEFIHHWWGNRITSDGIGKFLLTEGMTVLFEWITNRNILGDEYFNLVIENAQKDVLEITGFDRSLAKANRVPPFGNVIIYKKAPLVLYQLMNIVGEDKFITYCRAFLENKGCYEWKEFLNGLELYCDIDLTSFNLKWINERQIPNNSEEKSIILTDKRSTNEIKLDTKISKYKKNRDHKKLLDWLKKLSISDDYWNKYYYYLGICYFKEDNIKEALVCFEKMDKEKDIKYYWEGKYQEVIIKKNILNNEETIQYIHSILKELYPIKNMRNLLKTYEELR